MFDRFTERARQVIILAQDESRALKHAYVGTEHLLLGLLREEHGIAARVLADLGIELEPARDEIARQTSPSEELPIKEPSPFSPRAKEALAEALRSSQEILQHEYVGTEDLLVGLVSVADGLGPKLLADAGASPAAVIERVQAALGPRVKDEVEKRPPGSKHKIVLLRGPGPSVEDLDREAEDGWELVALLPREADLPARAVYKRKV